MAETRELHGKPSTAEPSAQASWHLDTGGSHEAWTSIVVPRAGTLSVIYEWTTKPADHIWVRDTQGHDTPIVRGPNTIPVEDSAMIMYQVVDRKNQIKLYYAMLSAD